MKLLYSFMVFFIFVGVCVDCLHILVIFPVPAKSHENLGNGFVRNLLRAGHQVTYITPFPWPKTENLTIVDLSSFRGMFDNALNISMLMQDKRAVAMLRDTTLGCVVAENTIKHPDVQKLLLDPKVRFDLVIAERLLTDVYAGFKAVLGVPLIYSVSLEMYQPVSAAFHDDLNPSYTANLLDNLQPPFSLTERYLGLYYYIKNAFNEWFYERPFERKIYEDSFSPIANARKVALPSLEQAIKDVDFAFCFSHFSLSEAKVMPENVKNIGGYHIEQAQSLPKDLQEIMDQSSKGVIFFSMGSNIKSKDLSKDVKMSLLKVFSKLEQTVLWKFEEDFQGELPPHVHVRKWLPQAGILAHPKLKLFITHGGLLSTTEAVHYGVPIIGIPVFADQFINIKRAERQGFGIQLDLSYGMADDLEVYIQRIFADDSFEKNAKRVSKIYHDRPMKPSDELVFWVEYVHRHAGAKHLDSQARHLPLYVKYYLRELLAILAVILYSVYKFGLSRSAKVFDGKSKKMN